MSAILDKIKTEPALITGAVTAVLALLVSFGVPLTTEQSQAIGGLVTAALVLVGAFVVRSQVTPTAAPKNDAGVPLVPAPYVGEHRPEA